MTKKQIQHFKELHDMFLDDCTRVANILGKFEKYMQNYSNIHYAEQFSINDEDEVCWSGYDDEWGCFPADYLTMNNNELESIIKEENEKFLKKKQKEQEEIEEQKRKKEFQEYQKLKEKFECIDTK